MARPSSLKVRRKTLGLRPGDDFTNRLGQSYAKSVVAAHGRTPRRGNSERGSPSAETDWGVSGTLSVGHSASSFSSVSVMSEATTVYTAIGQGDIEDKVTAVERLLNRAQQELGGQVGSFRLKGPRYRFAGRSSVVAFAEGMWGGDYALKFYCDPQAAEREFNIYRQATELDMSLPDVHEIEDNAGGVLRLRDGTPLPPFMAMLRGLPLPEWYALHVPSQIAVLETLAQVVKRLEQLHASGFCHNDIKPANILLLDGPNGGMPRWHLVDFTSIAQSGSQIRARYTLEYVSPEFVRAVAAMRAHTITCQRSMDIWSMGVIVYELMTCEPFFPLDAGRDMMRDGLMGLEPLPIEEDPRSIARIPKEGRLRSTVMAMLSREPASRPSASKVLQSIKDCIKELTGESPHEHDEASPVSSIEYSTSMVNNG